MLKKIFSLILSVLMLCGSVLTQGRDQLEIDKQTQAARIELLEEQYKNGEIPPVDESAIFDGDLQAELDGGIRFNELSFVATHNSYQTESVPAYRELYSTLSDLTFGLVKKTAGGLNSETLTEQLNLGIRSIEIDIETMVENGSTSFICTHSPVIDMTTNSYDFKLALKEIYLWSENNPNHLPITIIIEPKKVFVPMKGTRFFNLKRANILDDMLRESLGEKLVTPADMLGEYESFEQMRNDNGWREVKDLLGKVIVLLHDTNVTEKYIAQDNSIKSQAMFPMMRYADKDKSWASFLLINKPDEALEHSDEMIDQYNLIIRTQADTYGNYSDERLSNAVLSRSQILSTDYPMKSGETKETRFVYFGENKTVRKIK